MWDLSPPTRDQTPCPLQWKHGVLTKEYRGSRHSIILINTYIVSHQVSMPSYNKPKVLPKADITFIVHLHLTPKQLTV